jgi:CRP-like cAMP-binding protein
MPELDHDAKEAILAGITFFGGCSPRQLRDIAQLAEERSVAAGSDLCHQGAFENEVYIVLDGEAEVVIDGRTAGHTHVGEIVGELAMLGNGRRAATLRAVQPMRVLVLDPREVDSVLASDPSSAGRLSQHGDPAGASG